MREAVYTTDPTWYNVAAALWSVGELNVAIIICCLPTLRPLLGEISSTFQTADQRAAAKESTGSGSGRSDVEMETAAIPPKHLPGSSGSGGQTNSTDCFFPEAEIA